MVSHSRLQISDASELGMGSILSNHGRHLVPKKPSPLSTVRLRVGGHEWPRPPGVIGGMEWWSGPVPLLGGKAPNYNDSGLTPQSSAELMMKSRIFWRLYFF